MIADSFLYYTTLPTECYISSSEGSVFLKENELFTKKTFLNR